jgi:hypothetical protein
LLVVWLPLSVSGFCLVLARGWHVPGALHDLSKRRGKMSAVKLNQHWLRRLSGALAPLWLRLCSASKVVGQGLSGLWSWLWSAGKLAGRTASRLRPLVPGVVFILLAGATIAAVVWLHSAARTSPDAWPTSVAAGTTATLALVTLWYAYLTHRLLEAQRSAPRTAAWEAALRDLSLYLNTERSVLWTASDYFPIGRPNVDPLDLMALADSRVAFVRIRDHLLANLGLLPKKFVVEVLPLLMRLVDADTEIYILFQAIYEAMEANRAAGSTTWTWDDAQQAHEASIDPERSEAWADIARGRYFHAAEQAWDDVSSAIDNYLVSD